MAGWLADPDDPITIDAVETLFGIEHSTEPYKN